MKLDVLPWIIKYRRFQALFRAPWHPLLSLSIEIEAISQDLKSWEWCLPEDPGFSAQLPQCS
jgi:hypothetical protein